MSSKNYSKLLHRYLGLPLCVLLFLAGASGILLNHRDALRSVNVPPALLPQSYNYDSWNRASVRAVLQTGGRQYIYGNAGVWLATEHGTSQAPQPYNAGLGTGGDEQKVLAMASDSLGGVWLLTQYALYREASEGGWSLVASPQQGGERLCDMQIRGDSLVLLGRSALYTHPLSPTGAWHRYELPRAERHVEGELLFRLVWALHSGEYFGQVGQWVVDALGLMLMLISLVGLYYTLLRKRLSRGMQAGEDRGQLKAWARRQMWAYRWHARLGRRLFWALLFVCMTGWMLRPPLMLGLLQHRLVPWRISHLYSDNPWEGRLRAIRYDQRQGKWLMHTTTGFYLLEGWDSQPKPWLAQPYISPMGINVFEQRGAEWLLGSLGGMYRVDSLGVVRDYWSDEPIADEGRMPFAEPAIAGAVLGAERGEGLLFDYEQGAIAYDPAEEQGYRRAGELFYPQPRELEAAPYSLWQWAVELHTGRLYAPLIGRWGALLFIFPFGLLVLLVFVTGYRRMPRRRWL